MNTQFYALKETNPQADPSDFTLRLAMAKKIIDDKAIIVAVGYEGGGCWSDYYAVYQLDNHNESVEEVIEAFVGFPDEDTEYLNIYQELNEYISKFCDDDGEGVPFLKEECIKDSEFNENTGEYVHEWNWDDEVHLAACEDWQIFYSWHGL
jgi:hypothetical protein